MKRLMLFALIALGSMFAIDSFADTGFTGDCLYEMQAASAGDFSEVGLTALAAGIGTAAIVPGEGLGPLDTLRTLETQGEKAEADAGTKLWCITQAEFDALKAKYKHLYILDVTFDDKERYQFISRRPTKEVIQAAGENRSSSNRIADLMIKNMIVAGNLDDLNDGVVYSRVMQLLTGIVKDGKKLFTKA
ncbi:MAG: hypothetical protein LBL33_08790 [Tannerella sp.]|jgi:hypothetical protein|nr:hypothetical protein [Tannerella sp.]